MSIESVLRERAGSKCELCGSESELSVLDVKPNSGQTAETSALLCRVCSSSLDTIGSQTTVMDDKHWFCLNESIWSEYAPVKVLAYRVLKAMESNPWASDLLSQVYLDDETESWAKAGIATITDSGEVATKVVDSNGTVLQTGDTVTLIKDLEVKGANFTAKRGTTVKGIGLTDDPKYVEGRVNGIRIVLVAAYLKKA